MEVNSSQNSYNTLVNVLMINSQGILLNVMGNDYFV